MHQLRVQVNILNISHVTHVARKRLYSCDDHTDYNKYDDDRPIFCEKIVKHLIHIATNKKNSYLYMNNYIFWVIIFSSLLAIVIATFNLSYRNVNLENFSTDNSSSTDKFQSKRVKFIERTQPDFTGYGAQFFDYSSIDVPHKYNDRYIAKYYMRLLHDFCMNLEKQHNNGKITSDIPVENLLLKDASDKSKDIIEAVVSKLNSFYHTGYPVIKVVDGTEKEKTTSDNELYLTFEVKKAKYLSNKYFYSETDQPVVSRYNKLFVSIAHVEDKLKIKQIRIIGIDRISLVSSPSNEFNSSYYLKSSIDSGHPDNFTKEEINAQIEEIYNNRYTFGKNKEEGMCFGPDGKVDNIKVANDVSFSNDCNLTGGVWDTKCEKDEDCPYFQANKNYPNRRGGCNKSTGYCEMPKGIKNISYKIPDNPENAVCYNHPDKKCVKPETSLNDKKQNVITLDYAFENDLSERRKNMKYFERRGLTWY